MKKHLIKILKMLTFKDILHIINIYLPTYLPTCLPILNDSSLGYIHKSTDSISFAYGKKTEGGECVCVCVCVPTKEVPTTTVLQPMQA